MTTPATMTVPELELLLHQETLQALRDLSREASGRQRRRLEAELARQGDWVPHWLDGDLTQQPHTGRPLADWIVAHKLGSSAHVNDSGSQR